MSQKVVADQLACSSDAGPCAYSGVFTAVNGGKDPVKISFEAHLATVRGQPMPAKVVPVDIEVPKYGGKVVSLALTPDDKTCQATWHWIKSVAMFTRPASTGCLPASGQLLAKVTSVTNDPQPATSARTRQGAGLRGNTPPPGPPAIEPRRADLVIGVPAPSGLEGWLMTWSAIIALIATTVTLVLLARAKVLTHTLDSPDLDFDQSLAANVSFTGLLLTAVGLGTVLPDSTQLMNKQSYAALSMFAAVLILLAPALFKMGQERVQTDGSDLLVGRVWLTAIAGGLLLWGALLQLGAFWFQLIEVAEARTITLESLAVFSYVLLAVGLGLCLYVPFSVIMTAKEQGAPLQPTVPVGKLAEAEEAKPIRTARPSLPRTAKTPGKWVMP
jgi:hypothetical protein